MTENLWANTQGLIISNVVNMSAWQDMMKTLTIHADKDCVMTIHHHSGGKIFTIRGNTNQDLVTMYSNGHMDLSESNVNQAAEIFWKSVKFLANTYLY